MKAVRLRLTQQAAHYRKEESVDNKMTYPLPFPSTVIGALHSACGYKTYHPMDISIQGEFGHLQKEVYVDHCFLNTTMDDRGMLVKMCNPELLSAGFTKVAKAKKGQGNSFYNGITIDVFDEGALAEYRNLKDKRTELAEWKKSIQSEVKNVSEAIKGLKKEIKETEDKAQNAEKNKELTKYKKEKEEMELRIKQREFEEYDRPISYFKNLTSSLKSYEVLYDVNLVIYISAADEILADIVEHIDDLQALGRSEDFVHVEECSLVELTKTYSDDIEIYAHTPMYVRKKDIQEEVISVGNSGLGTVYYANKNYTINAKTGKREFVKIPVVYVGSPTLDVELIENSKWTWVDDADKENPLIVNFL